MLTHLQYSSFTAVCHWFAAQIVRLRSAAIAALMTLFLTSSASAATYYVATTGNNANNGSAGAPWRTLQFAADRVVAGDTVIVRPGEYVGFVLGWDGPQNGTPSQRITFHGEPGAIVNQRNVHTPDGINLEGASYITIEGFTVLSLPRAGIRSVLNNHVIIRNNRGDNNGRWGILTGFSDDILIENNEMSRSQAEHGIYFGNSADRPIIRGNKVWGNRANGIHINSDESQGGDGIISGALIENNIIYDNGLGGGSGINCDGVQDSIIRNNLLYNNHASGISLYRIDGKEGAKRNLVVNNTISMPSNGRWALNIVNGSTNTTIYNNIFFNQHSFRGAITVDAESMPGLVSDYNVVMSRLSNDDGNTVLTLEGWRSATGQDLHSVVSTPAATFLNLAQDNYHLSDTSPAIDRGTSTQAPALDIEGNQRPSGATWDAGAYEFVRACDPNGDPGGPDVGDPPPGDSDFDGVTDSQEITDGTDPTDPGSFRSRLTNPVFTVWNGFLSMTNILELVNTGATTATVKISIYLPDGNFCNQVQFTIGSRQQRDIIVNDLPGFQRDSYGIVKIEYTGTIDGRVVTYRPSSIAGGFDFAFAIPLRNPSYGKSAVAFNTYQPSLNPSELGNKVANWLTIINLSQSTKSYAIRYYNHAGALLLTANESVPPKKRLDRQAGHENPGPNTVGLITITPNDYLAPYLAHVTRYGYGDAAGQSFTFAGPLLARAGNGRPTLVPLSSTLSASNWLEVVNTSDQAVPTVVEFFTNSGSSVGNESVTLSPRSQLHFDASARLGPEQTGFARVTPSVKNSLITQSMFYIRDPNTGSIRAMYGSQAKEALAGTFYGSYNRFLGMANWLKVLNPSSGSIAVRVTVDHPAGQTVKDYTLAGRSTMDLGIHENAIFGTVPDTYGVLTVQSSSPLVSELLRVHYEPNTAVVDFLAPFPLP